jgi:hypothetical protein
MAVHFAKFSSQKPAASINSADGKNKDFFRVDSEKRGVFCIFYLSRFIRLGGSRLKIERIASQLWPGPKVHNFNASFHLKQDGESRPVFLCLARPAESHYNAAL